MFFFFVVFFAFFCRFWSQALASLSPEGVAAWLIDKGFGEYAEKFMENKVAFLLPVTLLVNIVAPIMYL